MIMRARIATKIAFLFMFALVLASCDSPEDRLAGHYAKGQELLEAKEHTKAAIEFRNALQINPKHVDSIYGLSQAVQGNGNFQLTARLLRQVLDINPKHFDANVRFGRILLLGGATDKALEHSNIAMDVDSGNALAWSLKASVMLNLGDQDTALEAANMALKIDPANVEAATVIAARNIADGKPEAALKVLDKSIDISGEGNVTLQLFRLTALARLKDVDGVEKLLRKMVSLYPDSAAFRQSLVSLLLREKRAGEAEAQLREFAAAKPEDASRQLAIVRFKGQVEGTPSAIKELEQMVASKDSHHLNYSLLLAQYYLRSNNRDKAADVMEAAVANTSNDDSWMEASTRHALFRLEGGEREKAEKLIAAVLEKDPKYSLALLSRARIQLADRNNEDAILNLRTALKDNPDSVQALRLLGVAHQMRGEHDLAHESYMRAFQASKGSAEVGLFVARYFASRRNPARAEDVLTQVLKRDSNNVAVWRMLAQMRLALQDWTGAQEAIDHLRNVKDDDAIVSQFEGLAMAGMSRIGDSINAFRRAHDAQPDQARPLAALVNLYITNKQPEEAELFLKSVLEAAPDNLQAKVLLAQVYSNMKRPEDAVTAYENAISDAPGQALGYLSYYRYLAGHGDAEQARNIVDMGLQTIPDNVALGLLKGQFITEGGDKAAMIDHFRKMYDRNPQSAIVANNYASLLANESDDPADIKLAREVASVLAGSDVPQFKDTLGWLHHRVGDYEAALPLLEDAASGLPELAEIRYHLGMTYARLKRPQQAVAELEQVIFLAEKKKKDVGGFAALAQKELPALKAALDQKNSQ